MKIWNICIQFNTDVCNCMFVENLLNEDTVDRSSLDWMAISVQVGTQTFVLYPNASKFLRWPSRLGGEQVRLWKSLLVKTWWRNKPHWCPFHVENWILYSILNIWGPLPVKNYWLLLAKICPDFSVIRSSIALLYTIARPLVSEVSQN